MFSHQTLAAVLPPNDELTRIIFCQIKFGPGPSFDNNYQHILGFAFLVNNTMAEMEFF